MSTGGGDGGAKKLAKASGKKADAAAEKITAYGDEAVSFTKGFYEQYITPMLADVASERAKGIARSDEIYDQQQAQFQNREGTYLREGEPAINEYFRQVREFDPENEAQRAGIRMSGDITSQQANVQAQTARGLAARGINPNSGMATAAMGQFNNTAGLVKAQEMSRLRQLMGQEQYNRSAGAAQFAAGLGGQAGAMSGQALKAGVIGSDVASQGTGSMVAGSGIPMSGLQFAGQGQSQLFGAYTGQQTNATQMAAQAAANSGSGFGQLAGTLIGGGLGYMMGGPTMAMQGAKIGSGIG